MSVNRVRQRDIVDPAIRDLHCTVIGSGSVGSFTAISLAKMGIGKLTLYDFDKVENHNLSTQWFAMSDIGKYKADALRDRILLDVDDVEVESICDRYRGQTLPDLVIATVDTMSARKTIWECVKRQQPMLYLDSRMGAEVTQLFAIYDGNSPSYEDNRLFSDEQAEPVPCTAKATIYGAAGTSSLVCAAVRRFVTFEDIPFAQTIDWYNTLTLIEAA